MTIHPLFTVHTLRPFYVFSNVLDVIEAECLFEGDIRSFKQTASEKWRLCAAELLRAVFAKIVLLTCTHMTPVLEGVDVYVYA